MPGNGRSGRNDGTGTGSGTSPDGRAGSGRTERRAICNGRRVKDTVDSYVKEAEHISELYKERAEVAAEMSELQQKLDKLNDKIDNINLKLNIKDENYPDYYDEWGID